MGIHIPFIKLKETELFYIDNGAGNTLIFIHGLGGTHYMFEPQAQEFEYLAVDFIERIQKFLVQ